LPVDGGRHLI